MKNAEDKRVLICGGGIIGTSIAYYLSERNVSSIIVERNKVAGAASGKAAGFLAFDWNDNSPSSELSRLSFTLHKQLAEKFRRETDYRCVSAAGVATASKANRNHNENVPAWLDGNVLGSQVLGTEETCAQVHPYKLTMALMQAAKQKGTTVMEGNVEGIEWTDLGTKNRTAEGVIVDGSLVPADIVVLAMGPWTTKAAEWVPIPPISAKKYHSVVVKPKAQISPTVVFLNHITEDGRKHEPEIYPRPDGNVYLCGEPQSLPLPDDPNRVFVDPTLCRSIHDITSEAASSLIDSEICAMQSCYLPLSPDGVPIIGKVPQTENVYIATGHSCWGILNAPATGLLMSELILDGQCIGAGCWLISADSIVVTNAKLKSGLQPIVILYQHHERTLMHLQASLLTYDLKTIDCCQLNNRRCQSSPMRETDF